MLSRRGGTVVQKHASLAVSSPWWELGWWMLEQRRP